MCTKLSLNMYFCSNLLCEILGLWPLIIHLFVTSFISAELSKYIKVDLTQSKIELELKSGQGEDEGWLGAGCYPFFPCFTSSFLFLPWGLVSMSEQLGDQFNCNELLQRGQGWIRCGLSFSHSLAQLQLLIDEETEVPRGQGLASN